MGVCFSSSGDVLFDTVEEAIAYRQIIKGTTMEPLSPAVPDVVSVTAEVTRPQRALRAVSGMASTTKPGVLFLTKEQAAVVDGMRQLDETQPGGPGMSADDLYMVIDSELVSTLSIMRGTLSRVSNRHYGQPWEKTIGHHRWRLTEIGALGEIQIVSCPAYAYRRQHPEG